MRDNNQHSQQQVESREVPQISWVCPVAALEGIHEHVQGLTLPSTAVETPLEAATGVEG